ncbi:MAG TPA: BTAD domain-containing putative transcriptional regulator [Actinomycetota bacterium]|nr:BTAD domain-containing putative transcriptional regulator [Actinomycetota bacterium]
MVDTIDFSLLGPLEARQRDRLLRLGSIKHRMLLAKLLLHANQVVSTDELIEAVWGEEPPPTVKQSLQNHIAALRKAIEVSNGSAPPRTLLTRDPGYLLNVDPEQLDLHRFQRLDRSGREALTAGDPATAADLLRQALALWRGPALADVAASTGIAWPELIGVEELQLAAVEARIEADLALGRHRELVAELEALVRLHPLREHLHGQLMLALYRSGRQADALAAYRAARKTLVNELGIEPSVGLQRLEQAILAQDPALELLAPAASAGRPDPDDGDDAPGPATRTAGAGASVERKLVSVLFAEVDEPAGEGVERDPEDVSTMLNRRLQRVRAEVESFGGTVEHAVGGITMAVFGVPQTREDDPERAVRAALAIRDALDGDGVEVRIAVTTGEALVTAGTSVAGDSVATCARLQQAAPAGTVLVSEATGRTTERSISYGPASLLSLAGRAKPMAVWSALEPRNRTGLDALAAGPVPLVGRDRELGLLLESYRRARAERQPRLVTVLGPPGIGKTRLVAELGRALDADSDLVTWRQGRSPPYGQGITYWALAEVVKAEAGILENDTDDRVERRLARMVEHALADEPAAAPRIAGHLRWLVGDGGDAVQVRRREEAFAAWRRFLHGLAARRPLVLVLEDLHWADDALLDFLEELLEPASGRAEPVPLLVVVTARPELLERRPGWGGERPGGLAELAPLSEDDTGRLLEALLSHHRLPESVGPALLAAAGGNPLFAEEYVRMLRDRNPLPAPGPDRVGPELPLPESVHAIVAARLDTLPPEEKAALQDLAVLGRVGWVGALAAVSGHDRADVETRLERLHDKEFLYRAGRSSMAGEREYGFRHVLVRDVAYGQIPRAERATKHRRAAGWLESLAPDHVDRRSRGSRIGGRKDGWPPQRGRAGRSELLAHHYGQALALASAAGKDTGDLTERARLALRDAGDRVAALGAHAGAARYYTAALAIWPEDDPERPELEFRAGEARCFGEGAGQELLEKARDGLLAVGARERAAEAEMLLGRLAYVYGRPRSVHIERALALVADAPASHSKAAVLSGCMLHLMVADRHAEALGVAREALTMARSFGARDVEAAALITIGAARVAQGDPGGLGDLERGVALSEEQGSSHSVGWHINLAYARSILGDLRGSFAAREAAWRAAERYGGGAELRFIELERVAEHYWTGRWSEATRVADTVASDAADGTPHYMECECRFWRGRIHLARGEVRAALEDGERALALAREAGDPQNLDPALAFGARLLLAADRPAEAGKLVDELLAGLAGRLLNPDLGVDLAVDLVELGRPAEVLDDAPPSPWREAARAFVAGDPGRAAAVYAEIGARPDEAYARLAAARRLFGDGRLAEGRAELDRALVFYREVGASAHLAEARELLFALT